MVTDAHSSVGPLGYFVGNGIMHYFPSLVGLWLADLNRIDLRPAKLTVDVLVAYAVFAVWLIHHDPYEVYGCGAPDAVFNATALAIGSTLVSAGAIALITVAISQAQSR